MQETRRRVLETLESGPATGPELAAQLDISRAAIWNHVQRLREAGFEITDTADGYELRTVPEYGAAAIEHELAANVEVEFHDELASTNATARERAADGADGLAVVAERQTGGRGRLDREWVSPVGGIYASLVTRPDVPPAESPAFTLAAAIAVAETAAEAGVDAGIKWPNDVLVPQPTADDIAAGPTGERDPPTDGAKLAGVLTEMEGEADRVSWLIAGIGVNANVDPAKLPAGATSLAGEGGPVSRRAFLAGVLDRFLELTSDLESVLPAWRRRALTLGREVRVETPRGVVEGTATDVEFPGALIVETTEGPVRVAAGDCEHLRPR
ncbi:biotin--[acetyl-CoA-carboxylase] ligase [Halosegnis sp.]|uniref:biotin--[acetyl-CoA-carboxylase] ligase n=1 Tax=Halosegnis sp. TaxID=2864959 RepID=UPI0035D4522B